MDEKTKSLAVGHIPSGLFVVCAYDQDKKMIDGFLGSWIQQVSFDPLLISLCIKPGRPAYDLICSEITFSINIIGDHDKSYMKHFWSGYDADKNPFAEIPHRINSNNAVVLEQAKSVILCKLKSRSKPGDHDVIVAEVIDSIVLDEKSKPLVHIRKSGLEY